MDITLTDNGDGSFSLQDADRATLAAAILLTDDYKGGGSLVKYDAEMWDKAAVYDPQAEADALQAQIDALVQQQTQASQIASKFKPDPVQPAPADPAQPVTP